MVYTKAVDDGPRERVLFGHGGSDGTHAWAWPELDLIVLFLTQSRGTLAGVALESVLETLLVEQALDDPSLATARVPSAEELEQVAGMYWDEDVAEAYYIVTPRGNRLTLERPGRMHLVFRAGQTPNRYVHEANAQVWLEFVRAEDGTVSAMRTSFGGRVELDPRHVTPEGLSSVAEVIASVKKAHRIDRLSETGVVRMSGTLKIEARKIEAALTTLFDATRGRTEINFGDVAQLVVTNDGRAWTYATPTGVDELDGERLEQTLLDRLSVRFGDWTEHYESVEVIKRVQLDGKSFLLVRVVPHETPGATMYVEEASGLVLHADGLAQLPGLGIVGVQSHFEDFRDVGGMHIPFRSVSAFASQLIGQVVTTLDEAEIGVEVSEETFAAPTAPNE